MAKKDELLKKKTGDQTAEYYDLNDYEKMQLASLNELVNQSRIAQDILFSRIVEEAADRLEISNAKLNINMDEVLEKGPQVAKLVVVR